MVRQKKASSTRSTSGSLPPKRTSRKQRLQCDLSLAAVERLDELVDLTGAASRAEVVRKALELFDTIIVNQTEGGRTIIEYPDKTQAVMMFL